MPVSPSRAPIGRRFSPPRPLPALTRRAGIPHIGWERGSPSPGGTAAVRRARTALAATAACLPDACRPLASGYEGPPPRAMSFRRPGPRRVMEEWDGAVLALPSRPLRLRGWRARCRAWGQRERVGASLRPFMREKGKPGRSVRRVRRRPGLRVRVGAAGLAAAGREQPENSGWSRCGP